MTAILRPLGQKKKWSAAKTAEVAGLIWAVADGYALNSFATRGSAKRDSIESKP